MKKLTKIEKKLHKQAAETRKELDEENKEDEKNGYIFFLIITIVIIGWYLIGFTKVKVILTVLFLLGVFLLGQFFNLLEKIGDFFEGLFKK
tara:strand:+ start:308 stop:580 length:273 start_codon:yes stop_codon:yes gene_type:complete